MITLNIIVIFQSLFVTLDCDWIFFALIPPIGEPHFRLTGLSTLGPCEAGLVLGLFKGQEAEKVSYTEMYPSRDFRVGHVIIDRFHLDQNAPSP